MSGPGPSKLNKCEAPEAQPLCHAFLNTPEAHALPTKKRTPGEGQDTETELSTPHSTLGGQQTVGPCIMTTFAGLQHAPPVATQCYQK